MSKKLLVAFGFVGVLYASYLGLERNSQQDTVVASAAQPEILPTEKPPAPAQDAQQTAPAPLPVEADADAAISDIADGFYEPAMDPVQPSVEAGISAATAAANTVVPTPELNLAPVAFDPASLGPSLLPPTTPNAGFWIRDRLTTQFDTSYTPNIYSIAEARSPIDEAKHVSNVTAGADYFLTRSLSLAPSLTYSTLNGTRVGSTHVEGSLNGLSLAGAISLYL